MAHRDLSDLRDAVLSIVYTNDAGYSSDAFSNHDQLIEIVHDAVSDVIMQGLPWEIFMSVLGEAEVTIGQLLEHNAAEELVHDAILSEVDVIVLEEAVNNFDISRIRFEDDIRHHEQVLGSRSPSPRVRSLARVCLMTKPRYHTRRGLSARR